MMEIILTVGVCVAALIAVWFLACCVIEMASTRRENKLSRKHVDDLWLKHQLQRDIEATNRWTRERANLFYESLLKEKQQEEFETRNRSFLEVQRDKHFPPLESASRVDPSYAAGVAYSNALLKHVTGLPQFPSRIAELEHECEIMGHEEDCVMCKWEEA